MVFIEGDKIRCKSEEKCKGTYCEEIYGREHVYVKNSAWKKEDLQLILESPKLKLRLSQKEQTLKIKVIKKDKNLILNNVKIGVKELDKIWTNTTNNRIKTMIDSGDKKVTLLSSQENIDDLIMVIRAVIKLEALK